MSEGYDYEQAPMQACWDFFHHLHRRALCALAGVQEVYASHQWDVLPVRDRAKIVKQLQVMVYSRAQIEKPSAFMNKQAD